jgi:hypothetical protein
MTFDPVNEENCLNFILRKYKILDEFDQKKDLDLGDAVKLIYIKNKKTNKKYFLKKFHCSDIQLERSLSIKNFDINHPNLAKYEGYLKDANQYYGIFFFFK